MVGFALTMRLTGRMDIVASRGPRAYSVRGSSAMTSRVRLALAAALCLYAAWGSRLWEGAREAWTRRGSDYASLRTLLAFDRVPILDIARTLDTTIPPEAPVALAPSIQRNGALTQRLTEGLYPRRVDRAAPEVLALAADGSVAT